MDWAYILVLLLSVLLAIFLIIAIILGVYLIKITRQIKSAAASAERTMQAIEGSVSTLNKAALPLMFTKGIVNQVVNLKRKKTPKKRNE